MSYDLTLFAVVPGEDPDDTVGELLESFDDELDPEEIPAISAAVAALVTALTSEFPDADVDARRDGTHALVSIEDGALTVDVFHNHCDVCITYAIPHDDAWFLDRVGRVAAATTAAAQLSDLYDMQLGEVVDLSAGASAMSASFDDTANELSDIAAEYGKASQRGGVFRKLFGRGG